MTIDELNAAFANSWYTTPEIQDKGYRFFTRFFIPSEENDLLVALSLAWPENPGEKHFASVVGGSWCGEYVKGSSLDVSDCVLTQKRLREEGAEPFVEAAKASMERLYRHVICDVMQPDAYRA